MTRFAWSVRIARAEQLARQHAESGEILRFYGVVAQFQSTCFEGFQASATRSIDPVLDHAEALLRLTERAAPSGMKDSARRLRQQPDRWEPLLSEHWADPARSGSITDFEYFFARGLLQPYAEARAQSEVVNGTHTPSACPFCSALPGVAVLRGEGDGAKRSLVCSLCATEWEFRRLLCPNCGEESKDNLPVFLAEGLDYVRVEACETCHVYIKAVDLTKNGRAVPVVDELATVALSVFAEESGYRKIQPNLLCM